MELNLEMLLQAGFLLYHEKMALIWKSEKILEFVVFDKIMGKNGKPEILYLCCPCMG